MVLDFLGIRLSGFLRVSSSVGVRDLYRVVECQERVSMSFGKKRLGARC
jgi:hypothetical protein